MPDITSFPPGAWSGPVTLTADSVVQAQNGTIAVTTQASGDRAGIILQHGDALMISSGLTVRAKALSNPGAARLAIEAVSV